MFFCVIGSELPVPEIKFLALKLILLFTEAEIKAGKSLAEILKNKEIPNAPEWKGDGIERPLTAAYEELTQKQI